MGVLRRIQNLFRRRAIDADIEDELKSHFALAEEEAVRSGMSPEEARRAVALRFGNSLSIRERTAEADIAVALETSWGDARHAVRQLKRSPIFTATVVVTLALGIGATTAIFTLIEQVILRPLPVERPEELWRVGSSVRCCYKTGYAQDDWSFFSKEAWEHFRKATSSFSDLAAFQVGKAQLAMRRDGAPGGAEPLIGQYVSGNFFRTFGAAAYGGRLFSDDDDKPGAPPVAVLSHRAWTDRFASDSSIIGATYDVNGHAFTIVGIAQEGFVGAKLVDYDMPEVWLPLSTEPLVAAETSRLNDPAIAWLDLIGRVRPGAAVHSLESQLQTELRDWLASHEQDMTSQERAAQSRQVLHLTPGASGVSLMRGQYEGALRLLFSAAFCVLLVACANVANLLLARGEKDAHQIALRIALGASRGRLIRKAMIESVVLSICGAAAGVVVAFGAASLILQLVLSGHAGHQSSGPLHASPSMPVLLFALAISIATGFLFGIGPAWLATRAQPIDALYGASRSIKGGRMWARKALVVAQVAISLVLLSVAAMLARSLGNLEQRKLGFETSGRYLLPINTMVSGYSRDELRPIVRAIEQRILAIPGVRAANVALYAPMSGISWTHDILTADNPEAGGEVSSDWSRITPGFFETVGGRIIAGRGFNDGDNARAPRVAVVNESFAKGLFKGGNAIGKRFGPAPGKNVNMYEIVGVAADMRYHTNTWDTVPPMYFVPQMQGVQFDDSKLQNRELWSHYPYNIVIWAPGHPRDLEVRSRKAVADAAPRVVTFAMRPYAEIIRIGYAQETMIASLTRLFGVVALILAGVGLYGVIAYGVEQRTAEIGVRRALGAQAGSIVAGVLGEAFVQIGAGILLGIPAALLAGRLIASQLFGVAPGDPILLGFAAVLLAVAAAFAASIPARRAAAVSPMEALRAD